MIKILCAEYINLQENISNTDKITFLNFLKECDNKQAAHLLLYGEMVSLDKVKITEKYIREISSLDSKINAMKGVDSLNPFVAIKACYKLGGMEAAKISAKGFIPHAIVVAAIITASIVLYKKYMSKAARACRGNEDKSRCIIQYKMKAYSEQIKKLKKDAAICKKSKNPAKCSNKIKNKINSISQKIQKQKSKL